ncbi:MAG: DUF4428 domain-containing protein [Coriobacteriales bacterium]
MGLFGSLFEKKNCVICSKELGLLGKRKLEDGYLCKDCASLLSPFFSERRSSTTEQIKEQLAYREANKERVAGFNVTRTLGLDTKVLVDEDAGCFVVTSAGAKWRDRNPDVIDFSQVTGCIVDVRETKTELTRELEDGTEESYDPPRYDMDYDVYAIIHVNSPYFDEICVQVNDDQIEDRYSTDFQEAQRIAEEIRSVLTTAREQVRESAAAAAAPKMAQTCPYCGATTFPDASGCCEYCGGAIATA